MGGGQIVHTVCMDTRDAIRRKNGEFTFRMGGDNPRIEAIKVGLGSLEFPMVQWSVEAGKNALHFSEGIVVESEKDALTFVETTDARTNEVTARVPPCINEIVEVSASAGEWKLVRTRAPHSLYYANQRSVVPAIDWADVEIICSTLGRLSLTALDRASKVRYVSDTEFLISHPGPCGKGGFVSVPRYPSPDALCRVLTRVLAYTMTESDYEIAYDPSSNRATLSATRYPYDSQTLALTLYGSPLAQTLGYPSSKHSKRFRRPAAPVLGAASDTTLAPVGFDYFGGGDTVAQPPLVLPSDDFQGWQSVSMTPGWYLPAHRSMCPGQPLRLTAELELALNRLYFPVPERIPQGQATAHFLMFTDPSGTVHNCPVYPGKYSPEALAQCLETEMTRLAANSLPGAVYTVDFEDGRFTFGCEVRDADSSVRSAPFSLLLSHPAQFDPMRIGFAPHSLHGLDSYTSTQRVLAPPSSNVYRVSDVAHQQRLRIHATPPPQLTCVIEHYDTRRSMLRVRAFSGQLPFVHGLRPGTPVIIGSASSTQELYHYSTDDGEWSARPYRAAPVRSTWGRSAVVVESPHEDDGRPALPSGEHLELWLRVKPTPALVDCTGLAVTVQAYVEPFNLCFGLPGSVSHTALGFAPGATQWGMDGSVSSGALRVPPFEAPAVHNLDHPDYVLIYFDEGKQATTLQHQRGTLSTCPFAKIVLFPTVREERMLPRETTLLSGESLSTFTLRFTNPDGTPYEFHGAHFSFSLNFVKVADA